MVTLLDVVPPKDYNSFVNLYLVRAGALPLANHILCMRLWPTLDLTLRYPIPFALQVFEYVDTDLYKLILSPQQLTNDHIETFVYQVGFWCDEDVCWWIDRAWDDSHDTTRHDPNTSTPIHVTFHYSCCCRSSTCSRRT